MDWADRIRLLHRPSQTPSLRRGSRAFCRFRGREVIVTSWTDARIPWPRCRALGTHRGGCGFLVDDELARAVRCESGAAIMHWWEVTVAVVWRWRRALGVTRTNNEGTRRLVPASAERGAAAVRAWEWT